MSYYDDQYNNDYYDEDNDRAYYSDNYYDDEDDESDYNHRKKRKKKRKDEYEDDYDDLFGEDNDFSDLDGDDEGEELKGKNLLMYKYRNQQANTGKYTDYDFNEIVKKYHSGNEKLKMQAKEDAINYLTGIIFKIIETRYSTYYKHMDDLVQEGKLGILIGLEKYDPAIAKPSTFFTPYIIHEIQKFIDSNVNKTTAHYSTNIRKINKAITELEKIGMPYTEVDVAIQTNLTLETVKQAMAIRNYRNEVNVEVCPESFINANTLSKAIPDPETAYIEKERNDLLYRVIGDTLTPLEIEILQCSFGLNNAPTLSYKDMSKKFNLPTDKIRRIYMDALRKLKNSELRKSFNDNLIEELPSVYDSEIPTLPIEQALINLEFFKDIEINF